MSVIDLSLLPAPAVVETLDYEAILSALKADLIARAPELAPALQLESEPLVKLLEVAAWRETVLRARINDAARAVMLPWATGADLDNLAARYDFPVSDAGTMFVSTDWNKQGYTSFVLYDSKEFNSKGDFEGGLKIGYSGNYGAYEVALFARNITNEKNLKGVIENYMAAVYNEPRTVGVSLNMNW